MGLAHGGLRQKNFNFYEETIRVPLIYSNPKLFPKPQTSDALVSHVDFLPTLASLAGAPKSARRNWQGVDYSKLVLHPKREGSAQDYVVFTYDDFQSGQATGPYPKPPNHVVSIREGRWKLAKYHGVEPENWQAGAAGMGDVRPQARPAREAQHRPPEGEADRKAGARAAAAETQAAPGRKAAPAPQARTALAGAPAEAEVEVLVRIAGRTSTSS